MIHYQNELLHHVAIKAGFRILSKNDCRILSEIIKKETGEYLSESTIYRLYLKRDHDHHYYNSTYDILSKYVEYESWGDFCERISKGVLSTETPFSKQIQAKDLSLLDLIIKNKLWNIAEEYFNSFTNYSQFEKFHFLGWSIYNSLKKNPESEMSFYQRFHNHEAVRISFFELAADPDFELRYYELGLKFYLKDVDPIRCNKDLQAYCFGHSLIIRKKYLDKNFDELKKEFEKHFPDHLQQKIISEINSVYPITRLYQASIFYYSCTKQPSSLKKVVKEYILWATGLWDVLTLTEKKAIIHNITEGLLMTNSAEKLLPLISNAFRDFLSVLLPNRKDWTAQIIIERTEFNGIRMQKKIMLFP